MQTQSQRMKEGMDCLWNAARLVPHDQRVELLRAFTIFEEVHKELAAAESEPDLTDLFDGQEIESELEEVA